MSRAVEQSAPTTPPMREVKRIIEVSGERGGTHVVHVLECGHWLTRRKAATQMRCIGCVIEGHVNDHRMNVEDAATFVMGALRAVERGMSNADREALESELCDRITGLHRERDGGPNDEARDGSEAGNADRSDQSRQ